MPCRSEAVGPEPGTGGGTGEGVMQNFFAWMGIINGGGAAILWIIACRVKRHQAYVVPGQPRDVDPIATAEASTWWNAWAAGVTAGAAFFQAVAQAIPTTCACLPGGSAH